MKLYGLKFSQFQIIFLKLVQPYKQVLRTDVYIESSIGLPRFGAFCPKKYNHFCQLKSEIKKMSEIENNIGVVKEKAKIKMLKKSIQHKLVLLQKYEAEVKKRRKTDTTKKLQTQKKSQKKTKPKKLYKCKTCDAKFTHKCAMVTHMRIHTGKSFSNVKNARLLLYKIIT